MKEIKEYSLLPHNTFGMDVKASVFVEYGSVAELKAILSNKDYLKPSWLHIGGGSNLLFTADYEGTVLHSAIHGYEVVDENDKTVDIRVGAGEVWDDFVAFAVRHGWYGAENLSLIPGEVGASAVQNIGAYGVEVKDFIQTVVVYDLEQERLIQISNSECNFSYRNSFLKNNPRFIVTEVIFKLHKQSKLKINYGDIAEQMAHINQATALDLRNCIISTRRSKLPDPNEIGNVGSFFHNPIIPKLHAEQLLITYPKLPTYPTHSPDLIKVSAGWLIDNLGLKGYRHEEVGIYNKQALVLVNYGDSTQAELLNFARLIQHKVYANYNIQLNIEPIIL